MRNTIATNSLNFFNSLILTVDNKLDNFIINTVGRKTHNSKYFMNVRFLVCLFSSCSSVLFQFLQVDYICDHGDTG